MFLHADDAHLWGNMIFLWIFGIALEKRVGRKTFLLAYFLTGILADLVSWYVHHYYMKIPLHGLGSSGAISGIMGVYMVRLYYKQLVFPFPLLGPFFLFLGLHVRIGLNALAAIGFYFFYDLSGGFGQIRQPQPGGVGHWAHIGGMAAGIGLGWLLKLQDRARLERQLQIGRDKVDRDLPLVDGEKSLQAVLAADPDNADAWIALARLKSRILATDEGLAAYRQAMQVLLRDDAEKAVQTFAEFHGLYREALTAEQLFAVAGLLHRWGEAKKAEKLFGRLFLDKENPPDLRERALMHLAETLVESGRIGRARERFHLFMALYPHSEYREYVQKRLSVLPK